MAAYDENDLEAVSTLAYNALAIVSHLNDSRQSQLETTNLIKEQITELSDNKIINSEDKKTEKVSSLLIPESTLIEQQKENDQESNGKKGVLHLNENGNVISPELCSNKQNINTNEVLQSKSYKQNTKENNDQNRASSVQIKDTYSEEDKDQSVKLNVKSEDSLHKRDEGNLNIKTNEQQVSNDAHQNVGSPGDAHQDVGSPGDACQDVRSPEDNFQGAGSPDNACQDAVWPTDASQHVLSPDDACQDARPPDDVCQDSGSPVACQKAGESLHDTHQNAGSSGDSCHDAGQSDDACQGTGSQKLTYKLRCESGHLPSPHKTKGAARLYEEGKEFEEVSEVEKEVEEVSEVGKEFDDVSELEKEVKEVPEVKKEVEEVSEVEKEIEEVDILEKEEQNPPIYSATRTSNEFKISSDKMHEHFTLGDLSGEQCEENSLKTDYRFNAMTDIDFIINKNQKNLTIKNETIADNNNLEKTSENVNMNENEELGVEEKMNIHRISGTEVVKQPPICESINGLEQATGATAGSVEPKIPNSEFAIEEIVQYRNNEKSDKAENVQFRPIDRSSLKQTTLFNLSSENLSFYPESNNEKADLKTEKHVAAEAKDMNEDASQVANTDAFVEKEKELQRIASIKSVVVKPRYANFMQSTSAHDALVRSGSMEETVKKLCEGAYLWKIRGVNKFYSRQYKIDREYMSLMAESKKWWSPGGLTGILIIDIVEVREGWKTDAFNKIADYNEKMKEKGMPVNTDPAIEEPLCFSVVHGSGGREVLDLMANSKEQRDLWVSGLRHLMESVQSLHQDRHYDIWLRKKFEAADKDKNGALTLDEICKLVSSLNLKMDKKHACTLFNEANKNKIKRNGEQVLDAQEFVNFYRSLLKMTEIENIYMRYANKETKAMGVEELLAFFKKENSMENYQPNQVTEIIHQFELSDLKDNNVLSFDGFYQMLLSSLFDIYNREHKKNIHQDMNQPLAHYYISSSHNTYLTGHQLAGESSVEGYISALKKGCRVVELDLWDGDEGEPIIYHGHTLTTKITLADVLRDAIKLYAFTASPYPVILSIENHLSIDQQVIMVKLFKQILGEHLLTDPVSNDMKSLPSPEALKHKIIIKAKKPQGVEIEDDDEDDDQDSIDYIDSDDGSSKKAKSHKPMAPELAQIVNVCEGKKFSSFGSSFEADKCVHFPSLRENKAKSLLESTPGSFIKFTERQIAKIYPLGTRTDSSNLKPYPFWSVGAQVVTLNMQTEDKATFYNDALFKSNGNCGYVLKPDILVGKRSYDPTNTPNELMKVIRVKVISGQHLPPSEKKNDIVDPYVQLKVRGHPDDKQKQKTKLVKNNGFNPVWNEVLEVRIKVPQVALVYFSVRDESSLSKDPVLALACIPFRSLCTGYRHVHLTDIKGKSLSPAALFVYVSIGDK